MLVFLCSFIVLADVFHIDAYKHIAVCVSIILCPLSNPLCVCVSRSLAVCVLVV